MRMVRDCLRPVLRHESIGAEQLEYPEVKSICRWQPLTNRERCSLNLLRNVVPNQMLESVALLDEHFQLVSLVHSILSSSYKNVLGLLIHLITTHLDELYINNFIRSLALSLNSPSCKLHQSLS